MADFFETDLGYQELINNRQQIFDRIFFDRIFFDRIFEAMIVIQVQ